MKPTYKHGYKSKPSLYGINDIDPMTITTPPEFLENETRQAMLNLNVSPDDLVINSSSNLDDQDTALLEQKRIETFNKVVEERNRLYDITYNQQPKGKKKATKKDSFESNDSNEQSPRKHHKNPRFKNKQNQNDQESNEGDTSDDVIREPKKVLKPKEPKRAVQQPKDPKNNAQQKNAVHPPKEPKKFVQQPKEPKKVVQQPQEPKPKKRYRKTNKQNQSSYYDQQNTSSYDDFSLNPSQLDDLDQDDLGIPKSSDNGATEFLYPDEIEREKKNQELIRKKQEYNRLKQKKFNDFMKEQERRKRLLYRAPPKLKRKYKTSLDDHSDNYVSCSTAIDMFTKKKQEQNEKELSEDSISVSTSREPRVRLRHQEAQKQIQEQEKLQQELEEIRQQQELLQKQQKQQKQLEMEEQEKEQKQMQPVEPNGEVVKKKRRRRVKKKVSKKRRHHRKTNDNEDGNNENPKNLIEATKDHPKVFKPKFNNTMPKKKWNGKSKIPRFVGSQEIYDDFYN